MIRCNDDAREATNKVLPVNRFPAQIPPPSFKYLSSTGDKGDLLSCRADDDLLVVDGVTAPW